jgi:Protein of unknown function (DUF3828)
MKKFALIGIALALTAAASHNPADEAAVRAAVTALFVPYKRPPTETVQQMDFDRPVFSSRTRALIERWKNRGGPKDIVTPLADGDWFCQCQDWDYRITKLGPQKLHWLGPNHVESRALFTVFRDDQRALHLVLLRENGKWLIDNLYFENERASLATQMRFEIAKATKGR